MQPVPDTLLDTFVERKVHPKTGQRMKVRLIGAG